MCGRPAEVVFTVVVHKHTEGQPTYHASRWLKLIGLADRPPNPDDWIRVAQFRIDSSTGSKAAESLVEQLASVGVVAKLSLYKLPDSPGNSTAIVGGISAKDRLRVLVAVQERDLEQVKQILISYEESNIPVTDDARDLATRSEIEYERLHPEESEML